jgi:hypothetical protein
MEFIVLDKAWVCTNVSGTSLPDFIVIYPVIDICETWMTQLFV